MSDGRKAQHHPGQAHREVWRSGSGSSSGRTPRTRTRQTPSSPAKSCLGPQSLPTNKLGGSCPCGKHGGFPFPVPAGLVASASAHDIRVLVECCCCWSCVAIFAAATLAVAASLSTTPACKLVAIAVAVAVAAGATLLWLL